MSGRSSAISIGTNDDTTFSRTGNSDGLQTDKVVNAVLETMQHIESELKNFKRRIEYLEHTVDFFFERVDDGDQVACVSLILSWYNAHLLITTQIRQRVREEPEYEES